MGWDKFEKLVELVKRRISQIVLTRLKDPRLGFVTITRIKLDRDLKRCRVYYSALGSPAEVSKTRHALLQARGFIQKEVGRTLKTRTMPRLEFLPEEALDGVDRVEAIFQTLEEERAERGDLDPEESPDGEGPRSGGISGGRGGGRDRERRSFIGR